MKSLLPLAVLTLIVSCTGNSSGGSGSYSAETLRENLTQKRGEVTITEHSGETINISSVGNRATMERQSNVYSEKEILLRSQGNETYTLVEESKEGKVYNRYVNLRNSDPVKEFQELLDRGNARVMDGIIYINSQSTDRTDYLDSVFDFTFDSKGTANLDKPNCSFQMSTSKSVVMNTHGEETVLKDVKSSQRSFCITALTDAQLKALDLSNVTLCQDEGKCETRNMEFLTDDL